MPFDLEPQLLIILLIAGFVAAFIDSVVGGGGLIGLPALLYLGLSPAASIATNKLAGMVGSLTSTITFYRSGKLDIRAGLKYFPLTFFGGLIGAFAVHIMDPEMLKPLMLIMLALVLVYTVFKKDWGSIEVKKDHTPQKMFLFIVVIFLIGFYDGFLGPGTGSFLIFAFLTMGHDFLKAAGNAKLMNFGSNLAALIMFAFLGQINYAYGIPMAFAQIFGAIVGSRFAIRKGSGYVRGLFIFVTVVLLAKNTYDFFFK
ncbi:sulfite exporter TauE/SafE family protein [Kurthia zopfii]|uniref:sulfite exporter TauE/SafE family protein n=1 Tax=Kurthia zopfii TaxID=1650 RepID=UPI000F6D507A|nr:TSUP family transporter [Kurthia zopfii]VEI07238.1 Sulfite exporter TauE/SafE [Kurthia zopfii]